MQASPRNGEWPSLISNAPRSSTQTEPSGAVRRPVIQDGFWTVKELAQYLRISERWIHERTRRNEIPCHRLGTALRFDPQEVHMWMIQRRGSGAGVPGAA
jgi:excisionase family DNA binding protein